MQVLIDVWKVFRLLPSAWLILLQFIILILSISVNYSMTYRTITWVLGVLVLLVIAKVIRQTPMFTILGLSFIGLRSSNDSSHCAWFRGRSLF